LAIFAIFGILSECFETHIMATMNVYLPDPMKDWVESRTHDGRFSNASDYVRHLR